MKDHIFYMERCFQLAEKGRGYTRTNPLVGAILVDTNGNIVSEGYHQTYGEAHAEVNCLNSVNNSALLASSTLYISLEPCNFYGKTPACTDLILRKGIKKVVVGSADFNPKVRLQGIEFLQSNDIDVINLNLEEEQKLLNISFFINQEKNEPYFIGKMAYSQDRKIGQRGEIIKISSVEVDVLSHKLRSEVDAIVVGKNTWMNDQPQLNNRLWESDYQPDIIVLSHSSLEIKNKTEDGRKISVISSNSISDLKNDIRDLGYKNILVEGGAEVFQYFMNHQLFHEIRTIENQSLVLKKGILFPTVNSLDYRIQEQNQIFGHLLTTYYRHDLFTA